MVPILDNLNIDVACIGNHDYVITILKLNYKDFGIESLEELVQSTKVKFPWLLSNLYDSKTKRPLTPGTEYHIMEVNGLKIGFMGLIEYDWVLTQNKIKPTDYIYEDYIIKGKQLVKLFKENNCDIIIALTHMRTYNDRILGEEIPEIDFILGGHDHVYCYETSKGGIILKSGTDFRELTLNKVKVHKKTTCDTGSFNVQHTTLSETKNKIKAFKEKINFVVETELFHVTSRILEDEETAEFLKIIDQKTEEQFKRIIGYLSCEVDARFNVVRHESCPINNFVADLIKIFMNTDCCLINSGSLRLDSIINEGEIT